MKKEENCFFQGAILPLVTFLLMMIITSVALPFYPPSVDEATVGINIGLPFLGIIAFVSGFIKGYRKILLWDLGKFIIGFTLVSGFFCFWLYGQVIEFLTRYLSQQLIVGDTEENPGRIFVITSLIFGVITFLGAGLGSTISSQLHGKGK